MYLGDVEERRSERVVKDWPEGGTNWRGSSQMKHVLREEREMCGCWVPQAVQMRYWSVMLVVVVVGDIDG